MAEDKTVLIKTAYSYYQKGDWERAIEEYHKLADLDPKDLNVHNMLADIYAKKGDAQEALQQYDLVAQGFDQKNQVDKVLQVYKRMLKLVPNDPELLNAVKNLIDKYLSRAAQLEESEPDKAIEIYRSVLKAEPNRIDANLPFAKLLAKKGQKFEGVEALMNLAMNLDEETQTGRLVEVLQAVTELDPLNIEAREKLINFFVKAKQTAAAVKSLQDLIEIYISKNDFGKAELAAQKTIDLGDLNTYYHLGVIFFNQQKYAESRTAFEKFLKQQEGHVGALKYLALAYLRLNQMSEAVQTYLKILDVYFNENLLDEAREVRQTILELDPANEAVTRYPLDQNVLAAEVPEAEPAPVAPTAEETAQLEVEEQQGFLVQAQAFIEKGFYEQAIDVYLE
ncbi:MAG TPA: tetratricopeptide repeat protein, partial [bacterium]|nr:tetratricopeptide repeat protein [bacterium]